MAMETLNSEHAKPPADTVAPTASREATVDARPLVLHAYEPKGHEIGSWFLVFAVLTGVFVYLFCRSEGWGAALEISWPWPAVISFVFCLAMSWLWLRVTFRRGAQFRDPNRALRRPISPEEYRAHGLGPVGCGGETRELYIDIVKRAVSNILYQDQPLVFYDHRQLPVLASGFDLSRRALGEDIPTEAQTMIGLRRLDNIRFCIEQVLRDRVAGDLVEAGVFRGGAVVFMRAVLMAHGVTDRCVFACDTFTPFLPKGPNWFVVPLAQGLGAIPGKWCRRRIFLLLQKLLSGATSFPECTDPSDNLIEFVMWHLRNPAAIPRTSGASLDDVKSLFARYGLLDDQVIFLRGFFSDTLPKAPLKHASVIRLDGDTYESTRHAITLLYPKLSPGGFCIIDDYNAFQDCKRAVEEYRQEHEINEELVPIDNLAVYWRKGEPAM